MPIPQSQPSPRITPVVSFPTPRGRCDLAFYEVRRGLTPSNRQWTYGEKHPNSRDYPNHELVAVVPQDHEWERWYYAAPRADQHNYNWEYSEQGDWEILGQTFFVKRCEFSLLTSDYPAPDAELFDSTGYVVTALEEQDVRDETLQSLYVIVRVRREKILNNPKVSTVLDPQTNTLRTVTVEKVPVGTAAEVVGEDGQYAEVQAANTRWALKTTQFMAGLAGNGDGAFQQWEDVINYSWPDVLDFINFFTFPSSSGTVKSIGARPVWKRQRYDGPCRARITETWTKDPPIPPVLDPMLPKEIQYSSPLLSVSVSPCLHEDLYIRTTPGTQHPSLGYYVYVEPYEATTLIDWPEIHVASFTSRPAMGGYLSRTVEVYRPDGPLFTNVLRLDSPQQGSAANSVDLSWTLSNQVGTLSQYRLDVCTNPEFSGSFLTGFNNLNVGTNTSFTVTGLTPGINYFARVRAVMTTPSATVVSNPQMLAAESVVSYTVTLNPVLSDGDTIDFGAVNISGTPIQKVLTIANTGNVTLDLPSVTKGGSDAAYWDVSAPATTVEAGESTTVTITFEPDTSRSYSGSLSLDFTNAPPMNLLLAGSAGTPIAYFELDSTPVSSGDSASFVAPGSTTLPPTQTLTVFNDASATGGLTVSGWVYTGSNPDSWVANSFDPFTISPGDSVAIDLVYSPTTSGSHTAVFELTHDATGSPFTLNVDGSASVAALTAPSSVDFYVSLDVSETQSLVINAESPTTEFLLDFDCTSVSIGGADPSYFSTDYGAGFDLAPGGTLTPALGVTFLGSSTPVTVSASLDIYHTDPDVSSPISIPLTGIVSLY